MVIAVILENVFTFLANTRLTSWNLTACMIYLTFYTNTGNPTFITKFFIVLIAQLIIMIAGKIQILYCSAFASP